MEIFVNGQAHQVSPGCTLEQLIAHLKLSGKRLAAEHNGAIVPRSRHAQTVLHAGDKLEIVHAIGGG